MVKSKLQKREEVRKSFAQFLPEGSVDYILSLFAKYPVRFKIVKPRSTKLGDFRVLPEENKFQITVNGNLNRYAFLVTTIHEFAHLTNYLEHQHRVLPHGEEWKNHYRKLWMPIFDLKILPKDLENALIQSMVSTKASSCSDHQLSRALHRYDPENNEERHLELLPMHSSFKLQGKTFLKGELRRKRYLCEELSTKRKFLVNALAKVTPLT